MGLGGVFTGFFSRGAAVYAKHRKFQPVISFAAGFAWDSWTMTRIDRLSDNIILFSYLLALAACILLQKAVDAGKIEWEWLKKRPDWVEFAIQFLIGGLFSGYVVYYSMSASFTKTGIFFLILVTLFVGNEIMTRQLKSLTMQTALLFLVSFSFFIFFLPVIFRAMGLWMFLASGLVSLGFLAGVLFILHRFITPLTPRDKMRLGGVTAGLYLTLNVFYFFNLIPPVPLGVKAAGVYHHVGRMQDKYLLVYEQQPFWAFWRHSDVVFHHREGEKVYCFSAVFAPTKLNTKIYHDWQFYDSRKGSWVRTDRIGYPITGGRDGGYRGSTWKQTVWPGDWRVEVMTEDDRLLSRISFQVQNSTDTYAPPFSSVML